MKKRINKPNVKRQIKGVKFIRSGRGFSKPELCEAGISNTSMAKNNGIPIDMLRRTKNPENVEQLKSIAKDLLNRKKQHKGKANQSIKNSNARISIFKKWRLLSWFMACHGG